MNVLIAMVLAAAATLQAQQSPSLVDGQIVPLWTAMPPGALGSAEADIPAVTVYLPRTMAAATPAMIVCPGGAYGRLAANHEGRQVAGYLNSLGIAAFVLRYRLGPRYHHPTELGDAQRAIRLLRFRAADWQLDPRRIGIIGFSAGGRVVSGVAFHYMPEGRPAFVAPIYAGGEISKDVPVPADAPPMFVAAATDDQLGLAPESVALYERWTGAHKTAELHLYAKGGHGFGMRTQNLPTDHWIDRFAEWLELEGFLKK